MKIQPGKTTSEQAIVLVVTVVLCAILGLVIGSYFSMIQTQSGAAARSQSWNSAVVVAEAGVEEAMAHLNSGITTNNLAVNSWIDLGGGNYSKTNMLGTSYSAVTIKIPPAVAGPYPVILSTSYVPAPMRSSTLSRTIQVMTKPRIAPALPGGLVISTSIDFSGQGITTDSFDSSNTNYN